jgi:hypothetical protein
MKTVLKESLIRRGISNNLCRQRKGVSSWTPSASMFFAWYYATNTQPYSSPKQDRMAIRNGSSPLLPTLDVNPPKSIEELASTTRFATKLQTNDFFI